MNLFLVSLWRGLRLISTFVLLKVTFRRFGLSENDKPSSFPFVLKIFVLLMTTVEGSLRYSCFGSRPRLAELGKMADFGVISTDLSTG